ncbi:MAG: lysophospholipid acyltransferase family protein [Candidatus Omnitrophica bacterium]|nr:lysophospholipid acyltransferase family protein [Candidatus Omnitrophota bacterium]
MKFLKESLYCAEYMLLRCLFTIVGFVPLHFLYGLAWCVGTVAYYILPHKRAIALENLSLAFGNEKTSRERRRIARAAMRNLVFVYLEFLFFARRKKGLDKYFYFDEDSGKRTMGLTKMPRAAMYLTGHIGNWELLALVAGFIGQKMHAIGRPLKNRYVFDYISRLRCSTAGAVIDKEHAVRGTIEAFKKKEIVGTLIDQRVGASGIVVDFFGQPAYTTPFPALMKIKYDCILYPAFAIREKIGFYRVIIKDEINIRPGELGNLERIKYMVQEYTKVMEEMVRAYPEQWLWYHRRWRI